MIRFSYQTAILMPLGEESEEWDDEPKKAEKGVALEGEERLDSLGHELGAKQI